MFSMTDCFFDLRLASLEPWKGVVMDLSEKVYRFSDILLIFLLFSS